MLEFIEIGRKQSSEVFCDILNQHPMLHYLQKIHKECEIELPLLNKVIEGNIG